MTDLRVRHCCCFTYFEINYMISEIDLEKQQNQHEDPFDHHSNSCDLYHDVKQENRMNKNNCRHYQ